MYQFVHKIQCIYIQYLCVHTNTLTHCLEDTESILQLSSLLLMIIHWFLCMSRSIILEIENTFFAF